MRLAALPGADDFDAVAGCEFVCRTAGGGDKGAVNRGRDASLSMALLDNELGQRCGGRHNRLPVDRDFD